MKPFVQARLIRMLFQGSIWLSFLGANFVEAQARGPESVNVVVQMEGPAKVKRAGWSNYASVVFGTGLQSGDLVSLEQGSHAKVVCSDLTLHDVPAGTGGVPCTSPEAVLYRVGGSVIHATRGWPNDGSSPIVLSPRKTKLLSPYPTLRWSAVKGITTYRVFIRGLHFSWVSPFVAGTQLSYPKYAPKLEPGVDYKMQVVTNDSSMSDEPGPGLGFSVLGAKDAHIVLQQQHRIEDLHLPDGPTQFLIAHLYANSGLYAEAIDRLEAVFATFKVAAVKRLQADLYMTVSLPRQAESAYLVSLDLSKSENDSEGQMLDHKSLAYIYEQIVGNREAACQQFKETLELARNLGDDLTASQAEKDLLRLKAATKLKDTESRIKFEGASQLTH